MSGKKGMRHNPHEVKLGAVRLFFEEGMTRAEITKAPGLRSAGRVEVWRRQYRCEGVAAFTRPIGRPRKVAESEQAELARLRMENTLQKTPFRIMQGNAGEAQYRVIYKHREEYEVKAMCHFFKISRAAYQEWVKHSRQPDRDAERMTLVREAWQKSRRTYGNHRVTIALQQQGYAINHKAVLRLTLAPARKYRCAGDEYSLCSQKAQTLQESNPVRYLSLL